MIQVISDVLTPDELKRFRELLGQAQWQDGRATAGHVAVRAKANEQLSHEDSLGQQLSEFLLERLGKISHFIAAALPLKVLPPRFNRYTGGGSYGDHIDNAIFSVPGAGVRIRGDLSATLFLSEPGDYDGGELIIQGEFARHQFKLPAGQMILYPASTFHQVTPVTRGARLAAFFWTQSLVREHSRRALLFELDNTIQALAQDNPEQPAVARLTGLYHNLLREWSET
ncbi:2OG-Fe(II) oxygenase [Nitrobacter winogradskyi Nb-255]|uniref:PKHD-type hydroxylase Nwi_0701 n=1 Tax=Nitrobacter winogradskyi (strain ATCC 25391 / DSM 10237 / CIP 104748 / NCIMB 11846 / Nb-255) TaxID=323098 RepID=Y701_NITWN|nr:Fe2+-dependent dioxygenase [Nitrobacter winogradskyi]Q3SUS4.1 RecName: Full=PKHD-type hydroxylase Nwi_0701 [Nitrobacter winogradskyi Nb-255]ABA03967.1 2OG-Fe(II) oxygenase [Nitrobacter winogradskyi Nb-255]